MTNSMIEKECQERLLLIDFLSKVLNLNPLERLTPRKLWNTLSLVMFLFIIHLHRLQPLLVIVRQITQIFPIIWKMQVKLQREAFPIHRGPQFLHKHQQFITFINIIFRRTLIDRNMIGCGICHVLKLIIV